MLNCSWIVVEIGLHILLSFSFSYPISLLIQPIVVVALWLSSFDGLFVLIKEVNGAPCVYVIGQADTKLQMLFIDDTCVQQTSDLEPLLNYLGWYGEVFVYKNSCQLCCVRASLAVEKGIATALIAFSNFYNVGFYSNYSWLFRSWTKSGPKNESAINVVV